MALDSKNTANPAPAQPVSHAQDGAAAQFELLRIADIHADVHQVRREFDSEALVELAASIAIFGVLQPILVRPEGDGYQIIAGERRWRAAQQAGLSEIPAVIRHDVATEDIGALQIVENIQRADLNLAEQMAGVAQLVAAVGAAGAAQRLGKSEGWISKRSGLDKLAPPVAALVRSGKIQDAEIAGSLSQLHQLNEPAAHWLCENIEEPEDSPVPTRASVRAMLDNARENAETQAKLAAAQARATPAAKAAKPKKDKQAVDRRAAEALAARQRHEAEQKLRQALLEKSDPLTARIEKLPDVTGRVFVSYNEQDFARGIVQLSISASLDTIEHIIALLERPAGDAPPAAAVKPAGRIKAPVAKPAKSAKPQKSAAKPAKKVKPAGKAKPAKAAARARR